MEKLSEYYQQSAASDAHIMAMGKYFFFLLYSLANITPVLNPIKKLAHFKKNWTSTLVSEVEEAVQTQVGYYIIFG